MAVAHAEVAGQTHLPANSYRTSTGAVFSRIEHGRFGKAVVAPDGMIWSKYLGNFSNHGLDKDGIVTDSAATRACDKIKGNLPTKENFEKLKIYFELDSDGYLTVQGRKDLHKVFPYMKDRWFWSATLEPGYSNFAHDFDGYSGGIYEDVRSSNVGSVLCVAGT